MMVSGIINQFRFALIMLLLFAILNVGVIYYKIHSMAPDGRIVNYAGVVRGNTQRTVKLEILQQNPDDVISRLDQVINGLINGDEELDLIKVNDREFQANMSKIEEAWAQLKTTLRDYRRNPSDANQERLLAESEDYWDLTDAVVSSAEALTKHHVKTSEYLTIILFLANLAVLAAIWRLTQSIKLRLKKTSNTLATSSTEISVSMEEQERVASQQAASVNEITTTMDELEASSRQSAEQAKAAVASAQQALKLAQGGTDAVGETLEGMFVLEKKVGAIAEQIVHLSEQANQIGTISQLVSDLANQTNMLALNSAVEASRAGEYGKGFTVVANEIRKLADQSQHSTEKINALVSEIQSAINSTVMVTEEGTKTVASGVEIAQRTEQAFTGVTDAVNKVAVNNQQISFTLKQQVDAIQQVVEAMEAINKGAKETASGISQSKEGTQQLNEAALVLKRMV